MAERKTLFMETTEVPAERSAAQIAEELIRGGATQISTEYEGGMIVGLKWVMRVEDGDKLFAMPARVEPVYQILRKRAKGYKNEGDLRKKARRIAWRQLLRWVQAQLAMIDCGMAKSGEVFFAYVQHPVTGKSFYDYVTSGPGRLLIEPPKEPMQ